MNKLEQLESEACEDGIEIIVYTFENPNIKGLYCDGVVGISDSLEKLYTETLCFGRRDGTSSYF